jgi:hypothetical protein
VSDLNQLNLRVWMTNEYFFTSQPTYIGESTSPSVALVAILAGIMAFEPHHKT